MSRNPLTSIALVIFCLFLLAGCGPAAATAEPALPTQPPASATPAPAATATALPTAVPATVAPPDATPTPPAGQSSNPQEIVIGYEGVQNNVSQQKVDDLLRACQELPVECVAGESIAKLAEQHVDAIISFSNRWDALGSSPETRDAVNQGIPVFVLNAESDVSGAYNLSVDGDVVRASLRWMFNGMGGAGEFVYVNFGQNNAHQDAIDEVLKDFPGIQATALPADYNGNPLTEERIAALVAAQPKLGAIWTDDSYNNVFWGMKAVQGGHSPLIVCGSRLDTLRNWKDRLETDPTFQCYSAIQPGGTGYEGVYAAYYLLSGEKVDPAALGGKFGNTFVYDYPVITNDNLDEWLGKLDVLRTGEWESLELPPMTPAEIKDKWFLP